MATPPRMRPALLLASAGAAALLATGCSSGGPTASGGGSSTTPQPSLSLCESIPHVQSVLMRRLQSTSQPYGVPLVVSSHTTVGARAAARALCSLPVDPQHHGPQGCGPETPVLYRLAFSLDGHGTRVATIHPTGCPTVSGVGPTRNALADTFYVQLAHAFGLDLASRYDFAGRPSM